VWINKSEKNASSSPCCNSSHEAEKRIFFTEFFWWRNVFSINKNENNLSQHTIGEVNEEMMSGAKKIF
jgi:hypothetical protein